MALQEAVARVFEADGPLARSMEAYTPRHGQAAMAEAVAGSMESGGALVVEAGTGVGKTFAYLVPALLSGQRVLVSTATKTLQDQLFGRDIPKLIAALAVPVRAAVLKGRSSYLCSYRLTTARHDLRAMHPHAQEDLARIESWSVQTRSGDLAELQQLDEFSPVIPLVTSTRENCLGSRCPELPTCHVNQARREALAADLVVVNHHLFFADLNIRESGVAELLPSVQSVVFDEAHQLNTIGVQFLGRQISTAQLDGLARDVTRLGTSLSLVTDNWPEWVAQLTQAVARLRELGGGGTLPAAWREEAPSGVEPDAWRQALVAVVSFLQQFEAVLGALEEHVSESKALRDRASELRETLALFVGEVPSGWVRWMEGGGALRMVQSPLDIAQAMQTRVIGPIGETATHKSWIFTSATLGHDATLSQFVRSCGLLGARVMQIASPFDYSRQAALYVPPHFPKPSQAGHSAAVADLVAQAAALLGGRTLVLTTTLRAMRDIALALRRHFVGSANMEVLVQGEASKRELTQRFSQADDSTAHILIASASFWEGVDVPGDALQLLVIDKLPFAPPDDPLVEARSQQVLSDGKNPFAHFHVPQAAIALKQGAGRLIRRETDRGILVVCDVRLTQMAYGRRIRAALPTMQDITSHEQFMQAIAGLTRPSTMGIQ